MICVLFFVNDTATTEIYTLSLHDALPICVRAELSHPAGVTSFTDSFESGPDEAFRGFGGRHNALDQRGQDFYSWTDRKSTRLNSSHANISYAVFCLKKKKAHNSHNTSHHS